MIPGVGVHIQAWAGHLVVELLLSGLLALLVQVCPWHHQLDEGLALVAMVPALRIRVERGAVVPSVAVAVGKRTLSVAVEFAFVHFRLVSAHLAVGIGVHKVAAHLGEKRHPGDFLRLHLISRAYGVGDGHVVGHAAFEGYLACCAGKSHRTLGRLSLVLVDNHRLCVSAHHEVGGHLAGLEMSLNCQVAQAQGIGGPGNRCGIIGNGVNVAARSHSGSAEQGRQLTGVHQDVVAGSAVHGHAAMDIGIVSRLSFGIQEVVDGGESILVILVIAGHGGFGGLAAASELELDAASVKLGSSLEFRGLLAGNGCYQCGQRYDYAGFLSHTSSWAGLQSSCRGLPRYWRRERCRR